jgi:hypothetical protein
MAAVAVVVDRRELRSPESLRLPSSNTPRASSQRDGTPRISTLRHFRNPAGFDTGEEWTFFAGLGAFSR